MLAFKDDALTAVAAAALRGDGFADADILDYLAVDATLRLRERVCTASEAADFGHEITPMRRYLALATRLAALCAVRYHRLASEDLI